MFTDEFPHVAAAILREAGWREEPVIARGLTAWWPPRSHSPFLGMTLAEAWHVYTEPARIAEQNAVTITITGAST